MTDGAVGSLFIVYFYPIFRCASCFIEHGERVRVEYLGAVGAVESFDVGVLRRTSRLRELPVHAFLACPSLYFRAGELRPVIAADDLRPAVPFAKLVEHTHYTQAGQAEVDFDRQCIACTVIDDVERALGAAVDQRVAHEVQRPAVVGLQRLHQCLPHPLRQATTTAPT